MKTITKVYSTDKDFKPAEYNKTVHKLFQHTTYTLIAFGRVMKVTREEAMRAYANSKGAEMSHDANGNIVITC